jgi:para-aminobenzoate synthetase component I
MIVEVPYEPLEIFQRLRHLPHLAFLDSARFHANHGRFSFLAADPQLIVTNEAATTTVSARAGRVTVGGDPWEVLDAMLSRFRVYDSNHEKNFPMGAAIGFLSYDMGRWLEKMPAPHAPLLATPDLWFGFYDVIFAFDHLEKKGWLISSGIDASGLRSHAQAEFRKDQFFDELQSDVALFPLQNHLSNGFVQLRSQADHEEAVRKALRYIHRGDIYQVNLAHAFSGTLDGTPSEIYLRLRETNPAPFGAYIDFGEGQVLSSSPERFLKMERRLIQSRPIKGTIGKTGDPIRDWKQKEILFQSAKNRAELLMITDLLRNDFGRIAEYGSVSVPDLVRCEEYETVFHLVSTIEAQLSSHVLHLDALAACFPGGSITGAPKLRAMEIIHELEPWKRGIYTGAMGYIGFNGVSDFNVAIRTMIYRHQEICFHVGGGIVADSDPTSEYEETIHKARGLLNLWTEPETRKIAT